MNDASAELDQFDDRVVRLVTYLSFIRSVTDAKVPTLHMELEGAANTIALFEQAGLTVGLAP